MEEFLDMGNIQNAETFKDLGLTAKDKTAIQQMAKGTKTQDAIGDPRVIGEQLGISRRKVMRGLEILGLKTYSESSFS